MQISREVVRRLRRERGWSQEHLAHLCDCSPKTIQRVESRGLCSLETRSALASVLEIELKQLDGEKKIEQARTSTDDGLLFYHRLLSGKAIADTFSGAYWGRFSNDDPKNKEDAEYMAALVQTISDWFDIWGDLDAGSRVEAQFALDELLREADESGMWVFGLRTKAKCDFKLMDGQQQQIEGSTGNFHVAYANSERIIVLDTKRS